jgi:undecaprenyl-diphosphatase
MVLAAAGLAVFAVIAYFVMTRDTLVVDTVIREFIYAGRSDGLTAFFTAMTYLGNWQTVTPICLLFLLIPRVRMPYGFPVSIAAILATVIQKSLKLAFRRIRPDLSLHLIEQGGYSFPSAHSFTGLVFYGLLIYLCRRNIKNRTVSNILTVLLSVLVFLIGFSRIYLGVHYPTDVAGGWSLGICVLLIIISFLPDDGKRRSR